MLRSLILLGTAKMCTVYGLICLNNILTNKKISKQIIMEFPCSEIIDKKLGTFVIFVAMPVVSDVEKSASKRHISSIW